MSYFIRQEKSKEYILEDNEVRLGSLTFMSWNSNNAIAKISNQELKFTKKGFWNSEYLITQDDTLLGKITSNWKGRLLIHLLTEPRLLSNNPDHNFEEGSFLTFKLKQKGFFNYTYELLYGEDDQSLVSLLPKSNWTKRHFEVKINNTENLPISIEQFIVTAAFSAIIQHKKQIIIVAATSVIITSS